MAINYWRDCGYVDDGCNRYQCLQCKHDWVGRDVPRYGWKFCPYCGTQWVGEFTKRNPRMWDYPDAWKTQEPHYWWIIECQYLDSTYWRNVCKLNPLLVSAVKAYKHMQWWRDYNARCVEIKTEERLLFRLVTFKPVRGFGMSYCPDETQKVLHAA